MNHPRARLARDPAQLSHRGAIHAKRCVGLRLGAIHPVGVALDPDLTTERMPGKQQGGLRALVRPGEILTPEGGKAVAAKPGMAIGDPDVLLEDLAPFTVESLKLPQISDEGVAEVVVTAAPGHPSSYVLIVHTIDPEQRIIVKTQYYRDWVGNLVKMRRTADVVEVGGHRRPGTITIENFRRGTTTHLSFAWREAPDAPAVLFEPAGLVHPSGLSWPNGK